MHVPEEHLEKYRALMALSRKAKSEGNARSNRGEYGRANRMWAIASMLQEDAQELRAPVPDQTPEPKPTDDHRRTALCGYCGETCKEYRAHFKGWGWNCVHCGYLTTAQVTDIARRENPVYSDGSPVVWI